ncbi:hypothetical protein Tco_0537017 [Tanacetum coccineum]
MTRRRSATNAASELWVEREILVNGVPWMGDGGVSGVSLSKESSVDDGKGEVTGSGGILSDDGSSDVPGSISDTGEVTVGVVFGMW